MTVRKNISQLPAVAVKHSTYVLQHVVAMLNNAATPHLIFRKPECFFNMLHHSCMHKSIFVWIYASLNVELYKYYGNYTNCFVANGVWIIEFLDR